MIDTDVMRLRQLRSAALRARALARVLNAYSLNSNSRNAISPLRPVMKFGFTSVPATFARPIPVPPFDVK